MWRTDRQTDILPRHSPRYAYASRIKTNASICFGFWTGWTSRDQKWKSCIGQTPSSTERISCLNENQNCKKRKIQKKKYEWIQSAKETDRVNEWLPNFCLRMFRSVIFICYILFSSNITLTKAILKTLIGKAYYQTEPSIRSIYKCNLLAMSL